MARPATLPENAQVPNHLPAVPSEVLPPTAIDPIAAAAELIALHVPTEIPPPPPEVPDVTIPDSALPLPTHVPDWLFV